MTTKLRFRLAGVATVLATAITLLAAPFVDAQTAASVTLFKKGGDEVSWCAATNQIAYASRGPDNCYGIHVCNADGSNDVWITNNNPNVPPGQKGSPSWHPSGKYILFAAEKPTHPGNSHFASTPGLGTYSDVWVMTADGSRSWQLTNTALTQDAGIIIPIFSHDGRRIVWADRIGRCNLLNPKAICALWDLKVADFVETPNGPQLANIRTLRPGGVKAFNESYGFTPDDRGVIFCSDFNQKSFWSSQIFTCDADTGGNLVQLTNGHYNEHATYSTDGRHIVWMTNAGGMRGTDWWMMDADGSNQHQITFFNKRGHPEFSPGKKTCGLTSFGPYPNQFVGGAQNSLIKQTGDSYMVTLR